MPNWCSNKTTITGRIDELARMMRDATVTDDYGVQEVQLNALIPMPDILIGTVSPTPTGEYDGGYGDYDADRVDELRTKHNDAVALAARAKAETGYSNWWEWQWDNWGIKWGASGTCLEQDGEQIVLDYETPWGPFSDEFFEKLTNLYDVHIENMYDEPGMEFSGGSRHQGGRTIKSISKEYPKFDGGDDDDTYWDRFLEMRDELVDEIERELWADSTTESVI